MPGSSVSLVDTVSQLDTPFQMFLIQVKYHIPLQKRRNYVRMKSIPLPMWCSHTDTHARGHLQNGLKGEAVTGDAGDTVTESLLCTALGLTIRSELKKTSKEELLSFSLLRRGRMFSLNVARRQKVKL